MNPYWKNTVFSLNRWWLWWFGSCWALGSLQEITQQIYDKAKRLTLHLLGTEEFSFSKKKLIAILCCIPTFTGSTEILWNILSNIYDSFESNITCFRKFWIWINTGDLHNWDGRVAISLWICYSFQHFFLLAHSGIPHFHFYFSLTFFSLSTVPP